MAPKRTRAQLMNEQPDPCSVVNDVEESRSDSTGNFDESKNNLLRIT